MYKITFISGVLNHEKKILRDFKTHFNVPLQLIEQNSNTSNYTKVFEILINKYNAKENSFSTHILKY